MVVFKKQIANNDHVESHKQVNNSMDNKVQK